MRWRLFGVALLTLFLVPCPSEAQQVNTTATGANWGFAPIREYYQSGVRHTQGFGQLFAVPAAEAYLQSLSFWLRQPTYWGESKFRLHIGTWNDATSSVSDIWVSAERDVTGPVTSDANNSVLDPLSDYGEQAFGGVAGTRLTPGQTYLAYLELSSVPTGSFNGGDHVAARFLPSGGGAVIMQDGVSQRMPGDLAFTATFTATPEPSTVLLLMTGLIGIGGMGWLRRRKSA